MTSAQNTNLSDELMHGMYSDMLRIRLIEEQIGADAKAGKIPGAVHLYIGQEAVGVGFCSHLSDDDWIASTHRGHGHFLAKGGDSSLLMAEIYGRKTGMCKGHGGSMHVAMLKPKLRSLAVPIELRKKWKSGKRVIQLMHLQNACLNLVRRTKTY